jgi:hypothetical protein
MAELAPIPSAMVRMAVAVKMGLLRRARAAKTMSRKSMDPPRETDVQIVRRIALRL